MATGTVSGTVSFTSTGAGGPISNRFFVYICTKSTNDPYIPPYASDIRTLSRDVSDGFLALSGGHKMAGQFSLFPLQRSVPSHLLCDGREVSKTAFPELYSYLGDSQGAPADAANFKLPNFIAAAAFVPAATAQAETVNEGTVSTPVPTDPAVPDYDWYGDNYGDVESGGKSFPPWYIP